MASRVSPSPVASLGRHPARREPQRVVRRVLLEHGVAQPGVAREQQVSLRLDQGPLVVDPLVEHGLGQPCGALERRLPQRLDGVPRGPVLRGRRGVASHPSHRVSSVELLVDVPGDVDVVDDDALEVAPEVHVSPVAVDDLQPADLAVADLQTGEVAQVDARTAELVGLGVLSSHRRSLAHRGPSARLLGTTRPRRGCRPARTGRGSEFARARTQGVASWVEPGSGPVGLGSSTGGTATRQGLCTGGSVAKELCYLPLRRRSPWWTQVRAVGLASNRAAAIGCRQTSQTP